MKHLGAIIEDRLKKAEEYGKDWPGKPVRIFVCRITGSITPQIV
jgi:hypothetical protein